jgi:hypothetical protein
MPEARARITFFHVSSANGMTIVRDVILSASDGSVAAAYPLFSSLRLLPSRFPPIAFNHLLPGVGLIPEAGGPSTKIGMNIGEV